MPVRSSSLCLTRARCHERNRATSRRKQFCLCSEDNPARPTSLIRESLAPFFSFPRPVCNARPVKRLTRPRKARRFTMPSFRVKPARIRRVQLCLAMLITAHGWTYGQQKEKGNEIEKPEATKPETSELNPAAKHATSFAAGAKAPTFGQDPLLDKWQMLFDLARQQHLQKDYAEAARNFAAIIEGKTTDEMKGACLVELAVLAQEQNQLAKAQQILAQYLRAFPQDQGVPEVLLRQGLLYRQMGAPALALSKFYAVMTSALTLKRGSVDHYQRLVLQAQAEIAETAYLQGKYEEATEFFTRVLKLGSADLN